jgi:branched-chain amino acid transport system ATP-binding protein
LPKLAKRKKINGRTEKTKSWVYEMLETTQLCKSFGGVHAVDHVNLNLSEGEIRAIIGPNGAGKTTLFNLITGMLKPDSGKIFFKGREITQLPPYKRTKLGIGLSFQLINIFPNLSIWKNVELAVQAFYKKRCGPLEIVSREIIKRRTEYIFQKYGMLHDLYVEAGTLNYADQRKLEITLALSLDPELILFDEPTAGLDEKETLQIMDLIKRISHSDNKTVLLVEHDVKFVMNIADKITVLDKGKVIAEGSPQEIAKMEEVQKAYLGGSHF